MALAALCLSLRQSTQAEQTYPQRTWRFYRRHRDFRKDFRLSPKHIPRLITALELPEKVTVGPAGHRYSITADDAISILLFTLATNATLHSINQKFGLKRGKASATLRWAEKYIHERWYKPLFVTDFRRWTLEPVRALLDERLQMLVERAPRRRSGDDVLVKESGAKTPAQLRLARSLAFRQLRVQENLRHGVLLRCTEAPFELQQRRRCVNRISRAALQVPHPLSELHVQRRPELGLGKAQALPRLLLFQLAGLLDCLGDGDNSLSSVELLLGLSAVARSLRGDFLSPRLVTLVVKLCGLRACGRRCSETQAEHASNDLASPLKQLASR